MWKPESAIDLAQSHLDVSQENVGCVMGYIVDLTVVLGDIFRTGAGNVSADDAQLAVDRHVSSGSRDRIHEDIRNFVAEIRAMDPQSDHVLEKIIDLIWQYCIPRYSHMDVSRCT